jgi:hypothetical protein
MRSKFLRRRRIGPASVAEPGPGHPTRAKRIGARLGRP